MVFFIIDAGARIQTPLEHLLDARRVQAVTAASPVSAIDDLNMPAAPVKAKLERAYREGSSPTPRRLIKFAREIMTSPVICGAVNQSLDEIWRIFADHKIHHLPLTDINGAVQGIVSDRDMMRFAANATRWSGGVEIGSVMTRQVITAALETEVRELAEVMVGRAIGAIPIIDEVGQLEGIVSRTDILRTMVHRAPLELWG